MSSDPLNFGDLTGIDYTGLSDTGMGYTGSSTLQDVQLGSPLVLDTSGASLNPTSAPLGPENISVPDFLSTDPGTIDFFTPGTQALTGASDSPPSDASQVASGSAGSISPASSGSSAALTGLSKFGASLAALFGGQPPSVRPASQGTLTPTGASLGSTSAANNGGMTLVLVVIVAALILLVARGE